VRRLPVAALIDQEMYGSGGCRLAVRERRRRARRRLASWTGRYPAVGAARLKRITWPSTFADHQGNSGPHGAHLKIADKDEAAGSSPARPTTPGLTWGNAGPPSSPVAAARLHRLRTAVVERITSRLTFYAAMLAPRGRELECLGRLSETRRHEPGAGGGAAAAKLEAGLLLVEAEPVGDRGRFPAAGDPQLGEDP
jgi:hypothetical protein